MSANTRGEVVSVTEKGQATIPKRLRERHGINAPGKVRVTENEDGEIGLRIQRGDSPLQGWEEARFHDSPPAVV